MYILEPCLTFIWAPKSDPNAAAIAARMMADNDPPIAASRVKSFDNATDMDNYLFANKQTVAAAVEFFPRYDIASALEGIDFGLQVNGTVKFVRGVFEDPNFFNLMPLQVAVERSIARFMYNRTYGTSASDIGSSLAWEVSTSEFAHPAKDPFSFVGIIAPTFLLAAAMFTFVVQVSNVVIERETKLRESMRVMGLNDSMFWLSWLAWETIVVNFISSLTIVIWGLIFQFDLFHKNSFGVLIFLFWFFELAMTGLGFFLSTFVSKASGATFMGFIIFLFGFIIMLVVNVGNIPYSDVIDAVWLEYVFAMFPPALLAKGILDLGLATATDQRSGIQWEDRDSYCSQSLYTAKCKWSLYEIYNWLLLDFAVYMVLCIYFDNVNANEYGVRKRPYFFLTPSYWFGARARAENIDQIEAAGKAAGSEIAEGLDTDVLAEESTIKDRLRGGQAQLEDGVALELHGLVKSFGTFHAVKGNWFRVETGKLFALLGPNGAGKTTTINCLTGAGPPFLERRETLPPLCSLSLSLSLAVSAPLSRPPEPQSSLSMRASPPRSSPLQASSRPPPATPSCTASPSPAAAWARSAPSWACARSSTCSGASSPAASTCASSPASRASRARSGGRSRVTSSTTPSSPTPPTAARAGTPAG